MARIDYEALPPEQRQSMEARVGQLTLVVTTRRSIMHHEGEAARLREVMTSVPESMQSIPAPDGFVWVVTVPGDKFTIEFARRGYKAYPHHPEWVARSTISPASKVGDTSLRQYAFEADRLEMDRDDNHVYAYSGTDLRCSLDGEITDLVLLPEDDIPFISINPELASQAKSTATSR